MYPDRPLYISDASMRYRYAKMVSRSEEIPEVDKRIQAPEGLRVRSLLFLFQDKAVGLTHRFFSKLDPELSFDRYLKWFVCVFSSLSVIAVFLAGTSIWQNRLAGLVGAGFYAVSIPSFERVIPNYLREEFALPFILFSFCFFVLSVVNSGNKRSANIFGLLAGAFGFLALSSWHLSSFYLLVFLVGAALVAFTRIDLKPVMRPILYVVGFGVLAGLVNEPLRTRLFLTSLPMIIGYCLIVSYAAFVRLKMSRRATAGVLIPLIITSFALVAFLSPNKGEYGHVYSLVFSKVRFLLDKPADPGLLSTEARLMWLGPFQSPSLFSFLFGFGAIVLVALYPSGVLLHRWISRRTTQPETMLLFMSFVFFLLYLLVRRLEVFTVFFIALLVAGIIKSVKGRRLLAVLFLLFLVFGFETFKAVTFFEPTSVKKALLSIKTPEVERLSIHDRDRSEIFRWIKRSTPADAVFLARFATSPMVVTYGERSAILHPIFETKHIREKVFECASAFYGFESQLYDLCRKYGVNYVLYEANQLLDDGELGERYMTDNLKLTTNCVAFGMHFVPQRLKGFVPVFQTDYFRVFRVREEPEEQTARYLRYSPQYDPSLFMIDRMGAVFSDSIIASAWRSIEKAFGLVQQGRNLMEQAEFRGAARAFEGALQLMPRLERARFALAECYGRIDRLDLSAATYAEMVKLDPLNSLGYLGLAGTYRQQNLLTRTVEVLKEGLALLPGDLNLLQALAVAYIELGDTTRGMEQFKEILEIDPSRSDARRELDRLRSLGK